MKNVELLEKHIPYSEIKPQITPIYHSDGESCCIVIKSQPIFFHTVSELIKVLYHVLHTHGGIHKIVLVFLGKDFDDKLSYVLLECYLEHILSEQALTVEIVWENKFNIFTSGMKHSPLQLLFHGSNHSADYSSSFRKSIGPSHYRKVFQPIDNKGPALSVLLTDLSFLFKGMNVPEDQAYSIAEVAAELVGNALEHTNSDCFLDVDITRDYVKMNDPTGTRYFGANLCVVNFSPTLLSSQIKQKIRRDDSLSPKGESSRYWMLRKIYNYHKNFFDAAYGEEEFFILSAFQDCITGRPKEYTTGGRGLPMLIKSLEQQSETDNCYVISGDRKMQFIQGLLEYDENLWIGMNQECKFDEYAPDPDVFSRIPFFFPGTAYNLNFVIPRRGNP